MRSFVIISVLIAVVAADVSHLSSALYNHNRPNSYVPPASGSPFDQQLTQQRLNAVQYASQYDGVLSAPREDTSYNQRQTLLQQQQTNTYQATQAREFTPGQAPTYQQTTYAQPQPTTYASQHQQQAVHELPPIVTKHFYVHAAPEDPEENAGPRYVQLGRAHKTYKVIFIKAPSYDSSTRIIPVLPQNQEKTIVYVLSKKPDINQEIQIPEQPVTEPPKPEVFFIKYKTQQEAEHARQHIQAAYDSASTDIDTNAIQQGAGLLDVRSSTDEQSAASSNQQQSGQYSAATNGQYDSGAYHAHYSQQTQPQYSQQTQPQYSQQTQSQYSQQTHPQYSASTTNYATSSLPSYLPPNHTH